MIRTTFCLATALMLAMTTGCAKQPDGTQNPDTTGGSDSVDGDSDGTPASSRARSTTSTRGGGRNTAARKITTAKPPRKPVGPVDPADPETPDEPTINGMVAQAFVLESAEALPDFASLGAAASSFEVPNLDFDDGITGLTGMTGSYALSFTGSLNIMAEAEYELCLHSDDGSRLLLENTLLVDNDGVHSEAVEVCELVYLAPGEYLLEIQYFQADGPQTLHFAWAVDGGDKVIVPTDVLFKPAATGR